MHIFLIFISLLFSLSSFSLIDTQQKVYNVVWPTLNGASIPLDFSQFIQPTSSSIPISGTFGYVRNDGTKFHEGIDIAPLRKGDNFFSR